MFILSSGLQSDYDVGIVSDNRSWRSQINYYYDGTWSRTIPMQRIKSFTLSDYSTDGNNITMGSVVGGKLTLNLVDVTSSMLSTFVDGTQIKLSLILENANATVKSSIYVVDDKKIIKKKGGSNNATITAFDKTYLMTHKYVTSLTEPTCIDIVNEIADKYGLGVNSSVQDAVTAIDGATPTKFTPLADFTYKQTLGFMAGCYGCFAYINESDEICFGWYTDSDYTIDRRYIYDNGLSFSEAENRTIVMLETGTKSNPIVSPNNASGHSINFENPYITQAQADAIYTQKIANGKISYRVGKAKYKGNPLYSPGTIVAIKDIHSQTSPFYIMKRTLNYDGGLSETIESLGESETTISFKITSPTQQKIDRALSRMEEAIKKSTDVITQTQGSIFELIPVDKNDASKGNAGFKIHYQNTGTSAFDDCVIMGTAGGVGLSTNNGQTFATAMYFYQDEAGEIHGAINGEVIRAGSISADKIDTSQLIVSKGNVDGLEAELESIIDSTYQAGVSANNASVKATLANANANEAKETANATNLILGGLTALENGVTVIKGSTILTGSIGAAQIGAGAITAEKIDAGAITAEKVNVGWQSGNCATGWTSTPSGYVTVTSDSSYGNNPQITMSSSYTSGNIDVNGIPFYASAGDVLRFGGRAYKKSSGSNGIYLKYSSTSDGTYNVVSYQNTANDSMGSTIDIDKSYTVTQAGWYMITVAFNTQTSGAYVTNLYCYKDVKGEMIVNGRISSVDGETYFDLDSGEVALKATNTSGYSTKVASGDVTFYYKNSLAGGLRAIAMTGISGASQNLYFENGLVVSKGTDTNADPYFTCAYDKTFSADCISFVKQANFLDAYFAKCRNIKSGKISAVTSAGASVTFERACINTPYVVCTAIQANSSSDVGVSATLTNVSKTGFTVRTNVASGTWGYGSDIYWIAIDIPNT